MPKISETERDSDAPASGRAGLTRIARQAEETLADAGREGGRLGRAAAGAAADASETVRHSVEATAESGRALLETLGEQARHIAQRAEEAAADTGEAASRSAKATTDVGRVLIEVFSEQTRHNVQAAAALARAVNWDEVLEVHRDYIDGSFGRMRRLGDSYRRFLQAGTTAAPSASRH
jgi:cell division septum initiation protein DivIVA